MNYLQKKICSTKINHSNTDRLILNLLTRNTFTSQFIRYTLLVHSKLINMVSNNTQVRCGVCQENIPYTNTPPPAWTVHTRKDGVRLSCCLHQIVTLNVTGKIETCQTRQGFSNLLLSTSVANLLQGSTCSEIVQKIQFWQKLFDQYWSLKKKLKNIKWTHQTEKNM